MPKSVIMKYTGPNIKKPDYMSDSTALLKTIEDDMVVTEDEDKAVPSEHLPPNVYVISLSQSASNIYCGVNYQQFIW